MKPRCTAETEEEYQAAVRGNGAVLFSLIFMNYGAADNLNQKNQFPAFIKFNCSFFVAVPDNLITVIVSCNLKKNGICNIYRKIDAFIILFGDYVLIKCYHEHV